MESLNRRKFMSTVCLIGAGTLSASQIALLTGCSTNWIDTAIADLPVILNVTNTVVTIVGIADPGITPAISAAIALAGTAAASGLALLKTLIVDYQANPSDTVLGKIRAAVSDIQTNLAAIMSQVSSITNSKLVAVISTGISLGLSVVSAILALLPPSMGAAVAHSTVKVKLLTAKEIKTQFNSCAKSWGYSAHQV